jgi:hypothetical protein
MCFEIPKEFLLKHKEDWKLQHQCLCIKGFFLYRDVFNKDRMTRFCYAYQDVTTIRTPQSRIDAKLSRLREFRKARPESYNLIT